LALLRVGESKYRYEKLQLGNICPEWMTLPGYFLTCFRDRSSRSTINPLNVHLTQRESQERVCWLFGAHAGGNPLDKGLKLH
jgi:hypothetical protein